MTKSTKDYNLELSKLKSSMSDKINIVFANRKEAFKKASF